MVIPHGYTSWLYLMFIPHGYTSMSWFMHLMVIPYVYTLQFDNSLILTRISSISRYVNKTNIWL